MCCHRLFIYSVCGHSHPSSHPIVTCLHASIPPDCTHSTTCTLVAHPYQSWKLETLCPECYTRRIALLEHVEINQVVKFDEWKWKVSYGMPAHGKDFWGRKAEEREKAERLREHGEEKSRLMKRFSIKRRSRRGAKSGGGDDEGGGAEEKE